MSQELEAVIEQAIASAVSAIPEHMQEIKENRESLGVEHVEEFVYGMIMGMTLGVVGAMMASADGAGQGGEKIRDIILAKMPEVRSKIFG